MKPHEKFMFYLFKDLETCKLSDYPNKFFYMKGNHIQFYFDKVSGNFWIPFHETWAILLHQYKINDTDVKELFNSYIYKYFKIKNPNFISEIKSWHRKYIDCYG